MGARVKLVSLRMLPEQIAMLDALVANSGKTRNEYMVERLLSTTGNNSYHDLENRIGEVGFMLSEIIEILDQDSSASSNEVIRELVRKYDSLIETLKSDWRRSATVS